MCVETQIVWTDPPEQLDLQAECIHIWRVELDGPESILQYCWEQLSASEKELAAACFLPKAGMRFAVARGALKSSLARYLNVPASELRFAYGANGKPKLPVNLNRGKLKFNLSHSRGLGLFVVTRDLEAGIDLEYVRERAGTEEMARRFFSPADMEQLHSVPAAVRHEVFFECWTRKEAYLKALGSGLATPMRSFDMALHPTEKEGWLQSSNGSAWRWSLHTFTPSPNYVAALAVEGTDHEICYWHWRP